MRVLQSDAWDVQSPAGNHVDWNTLQIAEASLILAPLNVPIGIRAGNGPRAMEGQAEVKSSLGSMARRSERDVKSRVT